jgi:hypothetical protein
MAPSLKAVYKGCVTNGLLPSGFLCSNVQYGCLDCYCKEAVQVRHSNDSCAQQFPPDLPRGV